MDMTMVLFCWEASWLRRSSNRLRAEVESSPDVGSWEPRQHGEITSFQRVHVKGNVAV